MKQIGENVELGKDVQIWHFTYIGDHTSIGEDTTVGSLTHIDHHVKIGKHCRIQGMVYIPPLTEIGDQVFIGPGAVFTNDPYPPSKHLKGVTVHDGATICASATVKAGVTIGEDAVVAMGAVVIHDIAPRVVVAGIPAKPIYGREEYLARQTAWNQQR